MWKLVCSEPNLDAEKKLHTLNAHVGRQTWAFDPNASEKDIEKQNQRRKEFRENRFVQKHSKDALMRDAFDARRVERKRERKTTPPSADGAVADEFAVEKETKRSLKAGVEYYQGQQHPDGHWPSDYGGPMFLMPGLIIAMKIMKKEKEMLPAHVKVEMKRYLENHVNEDGGVGLHIEGHSTMFGSVLTYVALRCLGEELESSETLRKMQEWI